MKRELVVDANDFVWWYYPETDTYSMVKTNPDNSPIPQPVARYVSINTGHEHGYGEGNGFLDCFKFDLEWMDDAAEKAFNRSNEKSDPPKCRTCRRNGLWNNEEFIYRLYQHRADGMRHVIAEIEKGCQAW